MHIELLGENFPVNNGADALMLLKRVAGHVSGIMSDLGKISKDVFLTKERVDVQTRALQWLRGQGGMLANMPLQNQTPLLAALAAAKVGKKAAPIVPSITGEGTTESGEPESAHRNSNTPPGFSAQSGSIATLALGTAYTASQRTHQIVTTVSGTTSANTALFTVNFNPSYAQAPVVNISEQGATAGQPYASAVTANGYTVSNRTSLSSSTTYTWNVTVVPSTENFD